MDSAFSRLSKVISLERKQGYRNKAVIGGLDKFASRWEPDAVREVPQSPIVAEIVSLLIGYPAVEDTAARERIIDLVARRIREVTGEDGEAGLAAAPIVHPAAQASQDSTAAAPIVSAPPEMPAPQREMPHPAAEPPAIARRTGPGEQKEKAPELPLPARSKPASAALEGSPSASEALMSRPRPAPGRAERPAAEIVGSPEELAPPAPKPLPPAARRPTWEGNGAGPAAVESGSELSVPVAGPTPKAQLRTEPRQRPRPAGHNVGLDAPVTRLPNIGPSFADKLVKLGVQTVRDLLYLLPRRYEDYSQLRTIDKLQWGQEVTIIGTVWQIDSRTVGDNRKLISATIGDGTGEIQATWFDPYVERRLRTGRAYTFSSKIESYREHLQMRNPEFEPLEKNQVSTARLVPVYPLTQGISARWLRTVMSKAIESWVVNLQDFLPEDVRLAAKLMPLSEALIQIHFPDNEERLGAAHRRLSFDEFIILQLAVLGQRQRWKGLPARPLTAGRDTLDPFLGILPFTMTGAQERVLAEIGADLGAARPMSRLLQGDVGSGKTAVAAAALWAAVTNGTQGAIMAPTEILAEQHARTFEAFFGNQIHPAIGRPIQIALFTGRMRRPEREAALAALAAGEIDIAIGTHALIQEDVSFKELTVIVVDEQHRFGVEQRAALRQKGAAPHMLVMSATPIPRSLALTIYGDLDVSVIDEMPAGRTPIKTKWLMPSQRERAYDFIRRQVEEGRQAFVIYPLVEENERSEAKAAVEESDRLQNNIFPRARVGLLHGRLRSPEKDSVMRDFGAGQIDVLVATSVVEVGIDVPNATVIVIEGAERFGLAQLHQFRGRVGRGPFPSYCILISNATEGESARRLQALERSSDGFALAQADLEMRGPGDFFGTRQSGLPPLRTAQLSDLHTLEAARAAAEKLFAADPQLSLPEHHALAAQVAVFCAEAGDLS